MLVQVKEPPRAVKTDVTPDMARRWLENNERNRHISLSLVVNYAKAMKEGRWRENGETVKIGRQGELLDGQHRCHGCVRADVPFSTWVVYGVDPDTFDTIDVGRKRTAGDILSIEGCRNGNQVASAYKWIQAYERRVPTTNSLGLNADQIRLMWVADPGPEESVARARIASKVMVAGAGGALHYLFSKMDGVAADDFFDDLAHGAGLSAHDPVLALREWLLSMKASHHRNKVSDGERFARCVRAWNHRRSGHKTKQLKGLIRGADGTYQLPDIE